MKSKVIEILIREEGRLMFERGESWGNEEVVSRRRTWIQQRGLRGRKCRERWWWWPRAWGKTGSLVVVKYRYDLRCCVDRWREHCEIEYKLVEEDGWQEDPLEKGMATHSCLLAWRTPRTGEPGDYSPWGRRESDMAAIFNKFKWHIIYKNNASHVTHLKLILYCKSAMLLLLLLSHCRVWLCATPQTAALWSPTRLLHPWDSPGKNTRVGCHFLL